MGNGCALVTHNYPYALATSVLSLSRTVLQRVAPHKLVGRAGRALEAGAGAWQRRQFMGNGGWGTRVAGMTGIKDGGVAVQVFEEQLRRDGTVRCG